MYINVQCMFTQNMRKGWQPYNFIVKDIHVFERSLGKGEGGGGLGLELFSQATNGRCTQYLKFILYLSFTVHRSPHAEISNVLSFLSVINCFELFFCTHFLFWEFLTINLTFVVCSKRDSKSFYNAFLCDFGFERKEIKINMDQEGWSRTTTYAANLHDPSWQDS